MTTYLRWTYCQLPRPRPGIPLPRSSSRMTGLACCPASSRALQAQTYPVERIVGVDTGSRDRSGAVLAELIGQDAVFGMDRAHRLRRSHRGRAAARRGGAAGMTDPGVRRIEWIWLLHDDCEPDPETLERLLRAASRDRSVVVLGPKVLDGQDRRMLREVGVSIDRAGRRVTGIEPGEIDQGQHDHNRAVLAVGSAGHARPARRVGSARRVRPAAQAVPRRRGLLLARPGGRPARAGRHRRGALPP